MEPITAALAKAGANAAGDLLKKESESFLTAALGEPAKAFGGLLADKINARRHANLVKITVQAKRKLDEAGVSAKEVPLKIIHPAIEAGSLEEDSDLQELWSNLLANAADPRQGNRVAPSFASILKEISPHDAKLVQALYQSRLNATGSPSPRGTDGGFPYSQFLGAYSSAGISRWPRLAEISYADMDKHADAISADLQEAEAAKDLLIRCGLLQNVTAIKPVKINAKTSQVPGGTRTQIPQSLNVEYATNLRFTQLGLDFVRACQPPQVA